MKRFSRTRALAGAIIFTSIAVVSLSGCGDEKEDATADHNKQDVAFAKDMIPHHAQAVEMAKLAPSRASNERVKSLATQIASAQQPEIDTMNGWLVKWGEGAVTPATTTDEHSAHGESMPGMMSASDMKKMEAATGSAFDRLFLEMMIEHHEGAIEMAKTETEKGIYAGARTLATSIISSQQAEITEMRELLK